MSIQIKAMDVQTFRDDIDIVLRVMANPGIINEEVVKVYTSNRNAHEIENAVVISPYLWRSIQRDLARLQGVLEFLGESARVRGLVMDDES